MAPRNDPQWWAIAYQPVTGGITYQYYEGSEAGAQAIASQAVAPAENPITGGNNNLSGPYSSKAAAEAAAKAGKTNTSSETQKATNPLDALGDIANFFDTLTQANTWKRVGLVAGGLIVVGLSLKAAISGQTPAQAAKQSVKTAGKVAGTAAMVVPK